MGGIVPGGIADAAIAARALQHADSAFPSGGFAFSQGLEAWHGLGRPGGEARGPGPARLAGFVERQLRLRWRSADRVVVALAHRAAAARGGPDLPRLAALDAEVEASTLNARFRDGSRRNGAALLSSHVRLGTPGAASWRQEVRAGRAQGHLAVVQGLAWAGLGLPEAVAVAMSGHAFLAGLASAAVRLNLAGALAAQAMLRDLLPLVAEAAAEPVPDDARPAAFTPLVEIAIMQAGPDGARLFSS